MIDLDKAAQAAEALGWNVYKNAPGERIAQRNGLAVGLFANGEFALADVSPLADVAPLIAAWAALAAGGTDDGQS